MSTALAIIAAALSMSAAFYLLIQAGALAQ